MVLKAVSYILAVEKSFSKTVKVFYLANKPIATERKSSTLLL
tara:strand:- start:1952 stop:2077 length:126 start_codon:yes stop_codon:yes gene_type:complete